MIGEGRPLTSTAFDGGGEMVTRAPSARHRLHVRNYSGYTEPAATAQVKQFPHRNIVLILNLADPLRVIDPTDGSRSGEHATAFVAGLHQRHVLTEPTGLSRGIQVNLTPVGARHVFGVSMDSVADRSVALEDVLGPSARETVERLREAPDWEARFDIIDSTIEDRLSMVAPPSEAVVWAWHKIDRSGGQIEIGALADELRWSRKRLVAEFRENVGVPPKTLARIARFDRAVRILRRERSPRWTDIAYRSGYFDQAHLSREFRAFAGITPGRFVLEQSWPYESAGES
jgi:AraC-like DNA-binding protein